MELDRFDVHDRFKYFLDQDFNIAECAQNMIDQRPFGGHPFYIFCHGRTDDDGISKRYIWSPWIWKPRAQTNTILLKAYPGTDIVKWMWVLPVREMWDSYREGKMFENKFVIECVEQFEKDKAALEAPEPDDPLPQRAQEIAFEFQPQLFKRESLPAHLKPEWDRRMRELKKIRHDQSEGEKTLS